MARGDGTIDVGDELEKVIINSNEFANCRHAVWLCRHVQKQQIAYRGRCLLSAIVSFLL